MVIKTTKRCCIRIKTSPANRFNSYKPYIFTVGETCRIRVKVNGANKYVGGIIRKVNKDGTCDVSTRFKFYENVRPWQRKKQDISNVVIPEVLKTIDTKRLLRMLQTTARYYYFWDENEYHTTDRELTIEGVTITRMQMKAELNNREHIVRNDERRDILNSSRERRNYKKNRKKNKRF